MAPPVLRYSAPSGRDYIKFVNKTVINAEILFDDDVDGTLKRFVILGPEECAYAATNRAYRWAIRNAETYQNLYPGSDGRIEDNQLVEIPLDRTEWCNIVYTIVVPDSTEVSITLPLYPLDELAKQVILRSLKIPDDVDKLPLPPVMKEELVAKMEWIAENKRGNLSTFVEYIYGKCPPLELSDVM